jgi:IgA Peptidase M64/Peptidase M64 N-terminus
MRLKTLLIGLLILPVTAYLQILTGPATYVEETTMDVPAVKVVFENYFLDKTMRLDFYHTGNTTEDHFATDQIVSDGIWPGSKTQLIDRLELGQYFFEVLDTDNKTLIYSRDFSSIFGEWQSTPEADKGSATFHESLRFPWPKKPVLIVLKKRNPENKFQAIWTTTIDPSSRQVNPSDIKPTYKIDPILENGPASQKMDIVILGDGYSTAEMEKFRNDAKRLSTILLDVEPFKSRKSDLNIRAIETPAAQSGVNKPHPGVFKRTPLSVSYGIFDSERYALTFDNKTVRNIASEVPYDFMIILINEKTYGGGGIYNLFTTVSADNKFADYIMVHEFGHHLGGLADEYYTSSVSYEAQKVTVEPWEPNVTALLDKDNLKWKSVVEPGTPIPTPWNKEAFDKFGYKIQKERDSLRKAKVAESGMEDLFTRQLNQENQFFSKEKYADKAGAFEGADYTQNGLYRPQLDCIMYTRHIKFCRVCRKSLETVIDEYTH